MPRVNKNDVPFMFSICYLLVTPPAGSANAPLPRASSVERGRQPTRVGAVVYSKGELSKGTIDRNWPHQVALRAERCLGANYVTICLFCEGLSLCTRGHSFRRDDIDMNVFCFAERAHAEEFRDRFGGEFVDPASRPKWPGSKR
jgi:hypothetical protein